MRISDWSSDVCSSDLLMDRLINRRVGLWQHLTQTLDGALLEPLRGLLGQADFTTPYRYLEANLSGQMDGRRRLGERPGAEAADPLEALLNAAHASENDHYLSIQRCIDWFDRRAVEIELGRALMREQWSADADMFGGAL